MMQAIMETLFDIIYLVTVISVGIVMVKNSRGNKQYLLFGVMAITLGLGDSFHLVPRAFALCTTGLENYTAALGFGKLVTSITMTLFYVALYYIWRIRYQVVGKHFLTLSIGILATLRIVLCLFPQNMWLSENAPLSWGIYRNIPFLIIGLIIIILFFKKSRQTRDQAYGYMWITITLSFLCYVPVVLWADIVPLVGILMIPKTCAYAWAIFIGYFAMKSELQKTEKA